MAETEYRNSYLYLVGFDRRHCYFVDSRTAADLSTHSRVEKAGKLGLLLVRNMKEILSLVLIRGGHVVRKIDLPQLYSAFGKSPCTYKRCWK
jgi:hypothetical protein